jgi:hypothetical protein
MLGSGALRQLMIALSMDAPISLGTNADSERRFLPEIRVLLFAEAAAGKWTS